MSYMVEIDSNGRILLPVQLRKSLGFNKGDKLALVTEGDHVAIVKKTEQLRTAQERFAALFKDKPHVGVEDFLEFRRMDAQLERDAQVMGYVLDTSVLLAYLKQEAGGDALQQYLEGDCFLSVVNQIEFYSYFVREGLPLDEAAWFIDQMGITVRPLDEKQVALAAKMVSITKPHGLSLGDRVCLALASSHALPVVTADKAWQILKVGVEVRLIRQELVQEIADAEVPPGKEALDQELGGQWATVALPNSNLALLSAMPIWDMMNIG